MEPKIAVSAPGKVILLGEHSVVHGKKAIACAIGSRVTVTLRKLNNADNLVFEMVSLHQDEIFIPLQEIRNILSRFPTENSLNEMNISSHVQEYSKAKFGKFSNPFICPALSCCLYGYLKVFSSITDAGQDPVFPALHVTVDSEIPIGAGLGSSAAFNTCISCSFLQHAKQIPYRENKIFTAIEAEESLLKINSLAYELEKIVHSTPSGIDNSIATYGGAVSFRAGSISRISTVPRLRLLIVDSGLPRSTKALVNGVKEKLNKFPAVIEPVLDAMHNVVLYGEKLLERLCEDKNRVVSEKDLGDLIITNQCLLSALGVSHPSLDKICAIAARHGFPAKLTGAGGGGCGFVLIGGDRCDKTLQVLKTELEMEKFSFHEAVLGGPGVMVKSL